MGNRRKLLIKNKKKTTTRTKRSIKFSSLGWLFNNHSNKQQKITQKIM